MQRSSVAMADRPVAVDASDFSLVTGGSLYRLMLGARLVIPPLGGLRRRVAAAVLVSWVPLLVLTLWSGHATGGVAVPFLYDIEAYARFVVAVPMLLLADVVVHRELGAVVDTFRSRGIVNPASRPGFEAAITSTRGWRDAVAMEAALLGLVLLGGPWAWRHGLALPADTWYAVLDDGKHHLTAAGYWFVFVSAPVFQFLLLRWYFRLALWWVFLWRVSRMPLALHAAHPDRAGGLGFLGDSLFAFLPLLLAQSIVVAGLISSRVATGTHNAAEFSGEVVVLVLLMMATVIVPLLFFSGALRAARRRGLQRYDALATVYVTRFQQKWLGRALPEDEPLLGTADIQTLADLAGSTDVVRRAGPFVFDLRVSLQLLAFTALPFFPLVLTVIPLGELVRNVVEILM